MENAKYNENVDFEELRAQTGIGSALYVKDAVTGKFVNAFLSEKIPSCSGDVETVEIDVTTSRRKTKIDGKETLNDVEFEVFAHRDNLRKLESMNRKTYEFLATNGDYTGERFSGIITYKNNERTSSDPTKVTVKITPIALVGYVDNALPLIAETARFISGIDRTIDLDTTTATHDIDVVTTPSDAEVTAVSESTGVCTVTVSNHRVTITGVAEGTAIVELTSSKTDYASMKRTILVRVPKPVSAGS